MLFSIQFTGGICETLGGCPQTHPKLPCACGWLWGEASACPWRQEEGTHPMMGAEVGEHQARSEVKRPRELRARPSITWAQESGELSVPIHRLGTGTPSDSSESTRASLGHKKPNRKKTK